MPISKEMDVKDLPSALMRTAEEIIEGKNLPLFNKASPKGAADHYNYKISIKNGKNRRVIECNQYNIRDDIKLLVNFIERKNNSTNY